MLEYQYNFRLRAHRHRGESGNHEMLNRPYAQAGERLTLGKLNARASGN